MKGKWIALGTAALGLALIAVGCAQATTEPPAPTEPQVPVEPPEPTEIVLTGSATKGGKLYDKW
jgi:hypothetical protein